MKRLVFKIAIGLSFALLLASNLTGEKIHAQYTGNLDDYDFNYTTVRLDQNQKNYLGSGSLLRDYQVGDSVLAITATISGDSTPMGVFLLETRNSTRLGFVADYYTAWGPTSDIVITPPNYSSGIIGGSGSISIGNSGVVNQYLESPDNEEVLERNEIQEDPEVVAEEGEDNSCESTSGVLGWIMCPVAGVLDGITGFLDSQIQDLLTIDNESVFEDESGEALRAVWVQIRNIAYVILIPIMLVMVIGTALGFEVFSAYTIKKALPRMIVAVIFITLSWYICMFLVEFANVVGSGIKGLVTSPFGGIEWSNGDGQGTPSGLKQALHVAGISRGGDQGVWQGLGEGITTAAGLGIAATGLFFTGGLTLAAMLSTLATAALVLGAVFLILIARQMFIIAALLVAPLAILAWIFPGNDKLWKLWWSMFSKLLMMFPLIMLILGLGEIFALVTANARIGENRLITSIMVIAAVIIPYALIPFTFRWAGGVFGNLAGMVNDKEKGVLDRLKKGRSERRAQGWQAFKTGTGTGFGQRNKLARGLGTRLSAGAGGGKGVFGFGEKGKARLDQMNRQNSIDQIMKNPAWNGVNQDDNALHAGILMEDMNKKDAVAAMEGRLGMLAARTDLQNATTDEQKKKAQQKITNIQNEALRSVSAWQAAGLGGRAAAIAAGQQLVSTGTGYADTQDMAQTLARASGGNTSTATALAGFANSETKRVGRGDLAPGFGNLNNLVQGEVGKLGQPTPSFTDYEAAVVSASRGQDPVTLLRGKPTEMNNLQKALTSHLHSQYQKSQDMSANITQADRDMADEEVARTIGQIEDFGINKGYASDDNQQHVDTLLKNTASIREERGDPVQRRAQNANDPRMQPPEPPAAPPSE